MTVAALGPPGLKSDPAVRGSLGLQTTQTRDEEELSLVPAESQEDGAFVGIRDPHHILEHHSHHSFPGPAIDHREDRGRLRSAGHSVAQVRVDLEAYFAVATYGGAWLMTQGIALVITRPLDEVDATAFTRATVPPQCRSSQIPSTP